MTTPPLTFNQLGSTRPGAAFPRRIEYRSELGFHWRPQDGWHSHDPTKLLTQSVQLDQGRATRAAEGDRTAGALGFYAPWGHDFPRIEMLDAEAVNALTVPSYVSEPATTNLVNNSEGLLGWSTSGSPSVFGGFDDPFDGTDMFRVDRSGGPGTDFIFEVLDSFTTDAQKAVSIFVAEGITPSAVGFHVRLEDTTAVATRLDALVLFDADGVPQVISTASGSFLRRTLAAFTGGRQVFRLEFLTDSVLFANTHQVELQPHDAGDGGDVFATGVQVDDAPFVSTYKRTSGAAAVGVADQLVIDFPLDPKFAQKSGGLSIMHTFLELGAISTPSALLFRIGNAAQDDPFLEVHRHPGAFVIYQVTYSNGGVSNISNITGPTYGQYVEMLINLTSQGRIFISERRADDITDFKLAAENKSSGPPTTSIPLPVAFSAQEMHIGGVNGTLGAAIRTLSMKVAVGILDHDTLRESF